MAFVLDASITACWALGDEEHPDAALAFGRIASGTVLRLARTHRLSVYDAAYLELAQREGLPLATLDSALGRAAISEGVELVS